MMSRKWIVVILMFVLGANVIYAQDMGTVTRISFYLKADANGIQQVYQVSLNNQSEARQITHATSDVLTFGAAYDGLSITYISDGQLWLQPIHTEEAEALAPVNVSQFPRTPIFSQDGAYIAYANNGVWLLDLSTRQTRQLLKDVRIEPSATNGGEFQIHFPERFVRGTDGKETKLIVDVGVWEWNTVGIYDLTSSRFHFLDGQNYTSLLPLYGERVLLYGNNAVGGINGLAMADSLEDINNYKDVLNFGDVTASTLFAEQAVEIHPGVVRIFGQSISAFPDEVKLFYFDYDMMAKVVGQLHMITVPNKTGGYVYTGNLSPDGSLLPVYHDTIFTDANSPYGDFSLIDLTKNETTVLVGTVGLFQWQP